MSQQHQPELLQRLQECHKNAQMKGMSDDDILVAFIQMTCYLLNQKKFCILLQGRDNGDEEKEGTAKATDRAAVPP